MRLSLVVVLGWAGVAGATTAEFLNLGAGARGAALGEAFSAVAADASAVTWNPAGLARVAATEVTLMHSMLAADQTYEYVAAAYPFASAGTVGIGVQYRSVKALTMRDAAGTEAGSLSPSDLAAAVAYGCSLKGYGLGVAVKFVQSKLLDSASTVAADLGVQTPEFTAAKVRIGAAVSHLGGRMTFDTVGEPLPMTIRAGAALEPVGGVQLCAEGAFVADEDAAFGGGVEYARPVGGGVRAALRAGYNTRGADVDGLHGVTLGFGVAWRTIQLDYGFEPLGDLGTSHRIALSWSRPALDVATNVPPAAAAPADAPVAAPVAVPAEAPATATQP